MKIPRKAQSVTSVSPGGTNQLKLTIMTDFDKQLIKKAENIRRWDYREIDILVKYADTEEARRRLTNLRWELYDSVRETI